VLGVNGKVDKSGQFHLLTFKGIFGKRMKELGSSSFIEIVVLDVDCKHPKENIYIFRERER
jgi:hypothetical protein